MMVANILNWFTGGSDHPYHALFHCMSHDTVWVTITVALDLIVGLGYGIISLHWWRNGRNLPAVPARKAMANMRNIFIFCCICGYMFIPIKMFWPAWRLYDMFLLVLVYFTWRYAWGAKDLKVVYSELGKAARLKAELADARQESKRKTAFLNALSHDLRTPLNGIALQSQVAQIAADGGDAAAAKEALEQINTSAKAAATLLENLLECARLDWQEEPAKFETFALIDALRQGMSEARTIATRKGLYLQMTGCHHLQIRSDRRKFERIVENLISNAVKFTDTGGVRIAVEKYDTSLELHVIDTGVGLSVEQQGRVFDEFYQAGNYERDREKGFGLGLAIARRLARRLGGDITVDSAAGYGSRFTLCLPGTVAGASEPTEPAAAVATVG